MNKGNFGRIGPLNDEQKNHDFSTIFGRNLDLVVIEVKHHGEISI